MTLAHPHFATLFGREAEATGRAHGRVNLIGDHTDYNDGFVLPTAIPQQTLVEVARVRGNRHLAYSATLDRHVEFDVGAQGADFGRYVSACLAALGEEGTIVPPVAVRIESTVPVGAGLSSSAALEVAMLRALSDLLDLDLDPISVAKLGQRAEVQYVGVPVGIMDQMACALASTDRMLFLDTRGLDYRLLPLPVETTVIVIDSGESRALAASAYAKRRDECRQAAALLGVQSLRQVKDAQIAESLPSPFRERARHVISENRRVLDAVTADASQFGALMNASHYSLRDDYEVSTPALDHLADFLRRLPGVFGARLTGAGFGGACVALARTPAAAAVVESVRQARSVGTWRIVVPAIERDAA